MRKQFLIVMSVAVVSFLLGTLFSLGSTAVGIMSNPFDNRLSEISELQTRLDSLNASLVELQKKMEIKIIRFTEPEEINITNTRRMMINTTSFVWKPNNPSNNTILSIQCYFEFSCRNWTELDVMTLMTDICIDGFDSADCRTQPIYRPSVGDAYDWRQTWFQVTEGTYPEGEVHLRPSWLRPNQENYTITFRTCALCDHFYVPTYVRNINIIMEVIDSKKD